MRRSNKLRRIRRFFAGGLGHNYGLPDCVKFVLERLGAPDKPDYWDIAAITGDTVAQVYNRNPATGCEYCVSGYLAGPEHLAYVFDALGYACEYVPAGQIDVKRIVGYINRGIPVLVKTNMYDIPGWNEDVGTYPLVIGYKNKGQTLQLLVGDKKIIDYELHDQSKLDFIFIGEKRRDVTLEALYLKAIAKMPHWLTLPERDGMFFGAAAFRAWADDIEAGRFEDEALPLWENYGVYVCNLATSPAIPFFIFRKLAQMSPAYSRYMMLFDEIVKLLPSFKPDDITLDDSKDGLWSQLEHLGAGMDLEKTKITMRDKEKRAMVADALRDYAGRLDKALALLEEYIR